MVGHYPVPELAVAKAPCKVQNIAIRVRRFVAAVKYSIIYLEPVTILGLDDHCQGGLVRAARWRYEDIDAVGILELVVVDCEYYRIGAAF